jgi:hypothetical protein
MGALPRRMGWVFSENCCCLLTGRTDRVHLDDEEIDILLPDIPQCVGFPFRHKNDEALAH